MLMLQFQVGPERYAIDAKEVVTVLPLVNVSPIHNAPAGVAGLFSCHGEIVAALDLPALFTGRPAVPRRSTRVILVRFEARDGARNLGLIAERVTQSLRLQRGDFQDPGLDASVACACGPVARDTAGFIHWVSVARLLPPSIRALLDQPTAAAAAAA